jgi:hypothetical protein
VAANMSPTGTVGFFTDSGPLRRAKTTVLWWLMGSDFSHSFVETALAVLRDEKSICEGYPRYVWWL